MPDIQELKTKYAPILDLIDDGIRTGNGWYGIIDELLQAIVNLKNDLPLQYKDVKVRQIKEKFGTLRVYVDSGPDFVLDALIKQAVEESCTICEECGSPAGKLRAMVVRCRSCRTKMNKENK